MKLPPAPPAPAWPEGCGVGRENNLFLIDSNIGKFFAGTLDDITRKKLIEVI